MNDKYFRYSTWDKINDLGFMPWFFVFAISTGLILLERWTPVYINNFYVRITLYVISAAIPVFWISWLFFGYPAIRKRGYIFAGVVAIVLAKALLTWGGDWKTQIVLYENNLEADRTIEFQMRADPFAFGYKKRIVERHRLLPFVDWVAKTDTTQLNHAVWTRKDIRINQLGLPNFTDAPSD